MPRSEGPHHSARHIAFHAEDGAARVRPRCARNLRLDRAPVGASASRGLELLFTTAQSLLPLRTPSFPNQRLPGDQTGCAVPAPRSTMTTTRLLIRHPVRVGGGLIRCRHRSRGLDPRTCRRRQPRHARVW